MSASNCKRFQKSYSTYKCACTQPIWKIIFVCYACEMRKHIKQSLLYLDCVFNIQFIRYFKFNISGICH